MVAESDVCSQLEKGRLELLDLSTRNRMLNVPRRSKQAKTIDIVDEKSSEIYRLVVREAKAMSFLPALDAKGGNGDEADEESEFGDLPQPNDDDLDERGVARRHSDLRLQTQLTSEKLQKRLLSLYYDAFTFREEQGVNILYLALGMLSWYESPTSEIERQAPLLLIPVSLERRSAAERFRLRWDQEDAAGNLSLQAKLKAEFGLVIPLPEDEDDLDLGRYFASVQDAVASQPRWRVLPDDMVLGFFSFSKFLMYRDLDPGNWPEGRRLDSHPLIAALLRDGFPSGEPPIGDGDHIDEHIQPAGMIHVVDADSSQTIAIEQAVSGSSMVIQGPPGTGKSQTITNIIAAAVARGEKVLFVAEKMAALEVVKRRLEIIDLGAMCLELHSHKTTKVAVLADLKRTSDLGRPALGDAAGIIERLQGLRDRLNGHSARLNTRFVPCSLSPFEVIGHLVGLYHEGRQPTARTLAGAESWSPAQVQDRQRLLADIAQRVAEEGAPSRHPWRGARLRVILPTDLARLMPQVKALSDRVNRLRWDIDRLAELTGQPVARALTGSGPLATVGRAVASAPPVPAQLLAAPGWRESPDEAGRLIDLGLAYRAARDRIAGEVAAQAWTTDIVATRQSVLADGRRWLRAANRVYRAQFPGMKAAVQELSRLRQDVVRLAQLAGQPDARTFADIDGLLDAARRLAEAPEAPSHLFETDAWAGHSVIIAQLIEAGHAHAAARNALANAVNDGAWEADVDMARQALAAHGASWLRFANGRYRRAAALLKSILLDSPPKSLAGRLGVLDRVLAVQKMATAIEEKAGFGRDCFGPSWQGTETRWPLLAEVKAWHDGTAADARFPSLHLTAAQLSERPEARAEVRSLIQRVGGLKTQCLSRVASLLASTRIDADGAFGAADVAFAKLEAVGARLAGWVARPHDFRGRITPQGLVPDGLLDEASWHALVAAVNLQNSILTQSPPKSLARRLRLFNHLHAAQSSAAFLAGQEAAGRRLFGSSWQGGETDWAALVQVRDWIGLLGRLGLSTDLLLAAARLDDRTEPGRLTEAVEDGARSVLGAMSALFPAFDLDTVEAFGQSELEAVELSEIAERLEAWQARSDDLSRWISLRARLDEATGKGLSAFITGLRDGVLTPGDAIPDFRFAYYEALLRMMAGHEPELMAFHGEEHDKLVERFRDHDRRRIQLARLEVADIHYRGLPRAHGGIGALGVLQGEFAKKRKHLPIRRLIRAAAPAIQALKPVFMMSPMSVAQYLEPGAITFDLLLIDEASQIMPIDALGAIARCRRMVVVGDERQLPPTRFFAKVMGDTDPDEDSEEETGVAAADVESILKLCLAKGLSERMLRWHYRSKHQSLIAVSNREFYESRLFIVPSPYTIEAGMGLRFHHVRDGVYDAGGTAANAVEARVVAEAVIAHVRATPNLSLGVATFSMKQRQAILDELERLRRQHPETEEFFATGGAEPFFVKNLENIQGDERDVIMISVGYGRTKTKALSMGFGPLSRKGGERRLNVLISRAKHRCEVFASITDEDIDLERARSIGVAGLKVFLQFARTGRLDMARPTDREHDSVFEEQVAGALRRLGYDVRCQIGIAGFFIDLAVADPERPGRYVLGIECDGASYHSARSARDRDRLRQEVLEAHGWIIHRIWSTDWFQRPEEQLRRTVAAIEAAKAELRDRQEEPADPVRAVPVEIVAIEREDTITVGVQEKPLSEPYRQCFAPVPTHLQPHEVAPGTMARIVEQIVETEGPIHAYEIVQRVRGLWNLKRAGNRIQDAVQSGLTMAAAKGGWASEGECWVRPDTSIPVRDRSEAESSSLRKPEYLPPQEIREALRRLVAAHYGGTAEDLATGVARLFGFKATSAQLKAVIEAQIEQLVQSGELVSTGGSISCGQGPERERSSGSSVLA